MKYLCTVGAYYVLCMALLISKLREGLYVPRRINNRYINSY
jgi:hypothetical protein